MRMWSGFLPEEEGEDDLAPATASAPVVPMAPLRDVGLSWIASMNYVAHRATLAEERKRGDEDCTKTELERAAFITVLESCFADWKAANLLAQAWLLRRSGGRSNVVADVYFNKRFQCYEVHLEANLEKEGKEYPGPGGFKQ